MNILLCRKVIPCTSAPQKEAPDIPIAKARDFTARIDKRRVNLAASQLCRLEGKNTILGQLNMLQ